MSEQVSEGNPTSSFIRHQDEVISPVLLFYEHEEELLHSFGPLTRRVLTATVT